MGWFRDLFFEPPAPVDPLERMARTMEQQAQQTWIRDNDRDAAIEELEARLNQAIQAMNNWIAVIKSLQVENKQIRDEIDYLRDRLEAMEP